MAMQLRLVDGHQLAVNQSLMASGTKVSFENVDVSREWLQAANTDDRKRKAFVTLVALLPLEHHVLGYLSPGRERRRGGG